LIKELLGCYTQIKLANYDDFPYAFKVAVDTIKTIVYQLNVRK